MVVAVVGSRALFCHKAIVAISYVVVAINVQQLKKVASIVNTIYITI